MARRSPPRARRWVAKEWRKACGVAVSGRPSAPRSRAMVSCTMRRRQRSALGADEQRAVIGQLVRAEREIIGDQFEHLRQHRHHALLVALAGHRDRHRRLPARESLRLRPSASEMRSPSRRAAPARRRRGRESIAGLLVPARRAASVMLFRRGDRQRLRQRLGDLRRAHREQRADLALAVALEEARERARRRARASASVRPRRRARRAAMKARTSAGVEPRGRSVGRSAEMLARKPRNCRTSRS